MTRAERWGRLTGLVANRCLRELVLGAWLTVRWLPVLLVASWLL